MKYIRNCPKCGCNIYHTTKSNRDRLQKKQKLCRRCGTKKMAINKKGKKLEHLTDFYNRGSKHKGPFVRDCPNCHKDISYVRYDSMIRAERRNSVCNSCSNYLYKKSWSYVIKDEHIKQMSATKAGYDSFDNYMADLDAKKKYRRLVMKITRQQDISILPNSDKLRGLCGVKDAYQLDHIISVDEGYRRKLPANQIGHIDNLQIIPWKENLLKSNV